MHFERRCIERRMHCTALGARAKNFIISGVDFSLAFEAAPGPVLLHKWYRDDFRTVDCFIVRGGRSSFTSPMSGICCMATPELGKDRNWLLLRVRTITLLR